MSTEAADSANTLNGVIDVNLPSYRDLQWRLDVVLDSRLARGINEPQYTLELSYSEDGKIKKKYMTCDFKTLVSITQDLEASIAQTNSAAVKRVQRLVPL